MLSKSISDSFPILLLFHERFAVGGVLIGDGSHIRAIPTDLDGACLCGSELG